MACSIPPMSVLPDAHAAPNVAIGAVLAAHVAKCSERRAAAGRALRETKPLDQFQFPIVGWLSICRLSDCQAVQTLLALLLGAGPICLMFWITVCTLLVSDSPGCRGSFVLCPLRQPISVGPCCHRPGSRPSAGFLSYRPSSLVGQGIVRLGSRLPSLMHGTALFAGSTARERCA